MCFYMGLNSMAKLTTVVLLVSQHSLPLRTSATPLNYHLPTVCCLIPLFGLVKNLGQFFSSTSPLGRWDKKLISDTGTVVCMCVHVCRYTAPLFLTHMTPDTLDGNLLSAPFKFSLTPLLEYSVHTSTFTLLKVFLLFDCQLVELQYHTCCHLHSI